MLLYLPPGPRFEPVPPNDTLHPILSGHQHDTDVAKVLASASLTTTVTVNYRLGHTPYKDGRSTASKFPTPVHDTLAGFDWIYQNLNPTHVCVFGRHIGGSLALMLTLTEPHSIAAVAAENPICDWVGLDDYCKLESKKDDSLQRFKSSAVHEMDSRDGSEPKSRNRRRKHPKLVPEDLAPLINARNKIFHSPQNYFDPFASPALFLRTTGKYCPSRFPAVFTGPGYPVPVIVPAEERNPWTLAALTLEEEELEAELADSAKHLVRRRKVLSRWPPVGLDYVTHGFPKSGYKGDTMNTTILPNVRIFVYSSLPPNHASPEDEPSEAGAVDTLSSQLESTKLTPEKQNSHSHAGGIQPTSERKTRRVTPRGSLPDLSKFEEETVLATQGTEMVHLMHNACFWGRSKGLGENRVKLVRVPYERTLPVPDYMDSDGDGNVVSTKLEEDGQTDDHVHIEGGKNGVEDKPVSVGEQAGAWFLDIFSAGKQDRFG